MRPLLDWGLDKKAKLHANQQLVKADLSGKAYDVILPRKASMVNYIGARTVNRHRWVGREF